MVQLLRLPTSENCSFNAAGSRMFLTKLQIVLKRTFGAG